MKCMSPTIWYSIMTNSTRNNDVTTNANANLNSTENNEKKEDYWFSSLEIFVKGKYDKASLIYKIPKELFILVMSHYVQSTFQLIGIPCSEERI